VFSASNSSLQTPLKETQLIPECLSYTQGFLYPLRPDKFTKQTKKQGNDAYKSI
jgi:hypothetical protein